MSDDTTGKGLTPYQFDGRNVRMVEKDGEMWFVATDVARELGYAEAKDLTRSLDEDEKGRHSVPTLGGEQELAVITEPGLYRAIIQRRANKKHDDALLSRIARFQRWVFHDVLPAIRKTGSYGAADPMAALNDASSLRTLLLASAERELALQAKIEADKPKTGFFDRFVNADGVFGLQNAGRILIEPPNKFIRWLKEDFLFYQGGSLVPRAQYRTMGLFEVKATMVEDKARYQTYVTPKGLHYLARKLGKDIPGLEAGA